MGWIIFLLPPGKGLHFCSEKTGFNGDIILAIIRLDAALRVSEG